MFEEAKDCTHWNCHFQRFVQIYSFILFTFLGNLFHSYIVINENRSLLIVEFGELKKAREKGFKSVAHLLMDQLKRRAKF